MFFKPKSPVERAQKELVNLIGQEDNIKRYLIGEADYLLFEKLGPMVGCVLSGASMVQEGNLKAWVVNKNTFDMFAKRMLQAQ